MEEQITNLSSFPPSNEQNGSLFWPSQTLVFRSTSDDAEGQVSTFDLSIRVDVGVADLQTRQDVANQGNDSNEAGRLSAEDERCMVCMERSCDAVLVECGHR